MKYTLLELVQSVLGSITGDEVNTYSETSESQAVANIIRDTYFGIVSRLDAPEHNDYFELGAASASQPTLMTVPNYVAKVWSLKYNKVVAPETNPEWKDVYPLPLDEFMERMYNLALDEDNVGTYDITTDNSDTIQIFYINDTHPTYYTTFDDRYILFDSYSSDDDSYLVKNKTLAFGQILPTWTFSDSFTPDLDAKQFQLLLNEAKVVAAAELKQSANPIADRNARRHWINAQRTKTAVELPTWYKSLPNYGRRRP